MRCPQSPILEALAAPERQLLLDRGIPRRLPPDAPLHWAGDRETRVHLVTAGLIKLTARDGEGRETILGLTGPGHLVGQIAALDGMPQPLDAIAATRCDLLGWPVETFAHAVASSPRAALAVAREIGAHSRAAWAAALERTSSEVPARLAGRLLELASTLGKACEGGGIEIQLPLGQRDLGRLAGMCRESACKTLRLFQRQGLLDYQGRRLRILDPGALELVRCSARRTKDSF